MSEDSLPADAQPVITRDVNVSEHWSTSTTHTERWSGGATREEAIANHLRGVENFRKIIKRYPDIAEDMPEVAGPLPITGLQRTVTKTIYLTETYPMEPYNGAQPDEMKS